MSHSTLKLELPDEAMCAVLRQKTEAERLAISFRMWSFARDMIHSTLRQEHPDWSSGQIDQQVARRMSHGAT